MSQTDEKFNKLIEEIKGMFVVSQAIAKNNFFLRTPLMNGEQLAKLFHKTYEELAPNFNYETRKSSAKPWAEVPENNKRLMIAVAEKILSVQKKQTAEDCIEDCAIVDENEYLKKAVNMLNSMVLSGEKYSEESKKTVKKVLNP